ncbi:MAG: hypothetical protein QOH95_542 [Gaiellaceae bacterium]|nr:hypothetical protein [Gaiellaceae bacterium]
MVRSLLAAVGAAAVVAVHGASGTPAQLLYVSTLGADGGGCTRVAPCRSFDAAYGAARPGAQVIVAAGDYPPQTVAARPRQGAPVVFAPAPGAKVVIADELNVFASHLEFRDMTASDWYVREGATDVTFRRMNVQLFFIRSASKIRVLGGSVGGIDDSSAATVGSAYLSKVPATAVLIDGVAFHDITRRANPSGHVQCLFVQSVDGLVIRNSTFRHCDVFDVFVNNIGVGPVPKNMLFENDLFDKASDGGFYSLFVRQDPGDTIDGLVVRYSSFLQGPHFDPGSYAHSRVVGIVSPFTSGQCTSGITFAHNVFDGARCAPTDRRAPLGYVDPTAFRLGLKAGAAGIDAGDAKDTPRKDIRGRPRPRGKAPDAGAYENA